MQVYQPNHHQRKPILCITQQQQQRRHGYVAINLRTGQQVWYQNFTVNPSFGILVNFDSPNQHGVIPSGYLVAVSGTTWMIFDAGTGNWVFNITNVPTGNMQYGSDGEPIIYQFDPVNHWLALWNFTDVITNGPLNALSSAGWRPVNQVINSTLRGSNAYSWNVTVPNSLPATSAIAWPVGGDLLLVTVTQEAQLASLPSEVYMPVVQPAIQPSGR